MKRIIAGTLTFMLLVGSLCGCAATERSLKTMKSEFGNGLDRTVTVYSYNGDKIDSWSGRFDVESTDGKTIFDNDGKRVIIQGGIVINEEN